MSVMCQMISNFEELLEFNPFRTKEQRIHRQDLDSISATISLIRAF